MGFFDSERPFLGWWEMGFFDSETLLSRFWGFWPLQGANAFLNLISAGRAEVLP